MTDYLEILFLYWYNHHTHMMQVWLRQCYTLKKKCVWLLIECSSYFHMVKDFITLQPPPFLPEKVNAQDI